MSDDIQIFWEGATTKLKGFDLEGIMGTSGSSSLTPGHWTFATDADAQVHAVLDGKRTLISSFPGIEEPIEPILTFADGSPAAVLVTTSTHEVAWSDVTDEQARGDGAESVESWKQDAAAVFTDLTGQPISDDTPVLFETIKVVYR